MKSKVFLILLFLLVLPIIYGGTSYNFLTKGFADSLYCPLNSCGGSAGNPFNQVLNTTSNVTFNQITLTYLSDGTNLYTLSMLNASSSSNSANINGTNIKPSRIGINIDGYRALTIRYNETAIFGQAIDTPTFSTGVSTNYLLQTEDFSTTWQKYNNITVTTNVINDPSNQSVTADRIFTNVSGSSAFRFDGMGRINQTITNSALNWWTCSIQVKVLQPTYNSYITLSIGSDTQDYEGNWTKINCSLDNSWRECAVTTNLTAAHNFVVFNIYTINNTNISLAWAQCDLSPLSRNYYIAQTTSASYATETTRTAIRGATYIAGSLTTTSSLTISGAFSGATTITSAPTSIATKLDGAGISMNSGTASTATATNQNSPYLRISSRTWNGTADNRFDWNTIAISNNLTNSFGFGSSLYTYLQVPWNNVMTNKNYSIMNVTITNNTRYIKFGQPLMNMTFISPNNSLFCCGVSDLGVFGCASGECV